ncbi:HAD family hydrolase [Ancylobacter dichloromethanicus]|uniref:Haloacid dehalogenase n=1 Tax=Ancylobacter dichloromethanicus TaxID=518825 RepID=A0A9W6MXF0_9HYPH|nr:HAD family hydrolase [Ancylobacter dichloromethanicus]MBS7556244.1 HAD family hydrolase [Ancylobacter dichloromethanicus]GLK70003.1 haloacid dehalogenase [Ancylobacter dichloromethanicus]
MEPALIIFDCDGVLIDSETLAAGALIDALSHRGIEVDLDFVARHFIGRAFPVILTEVKARFGVDLPPPFEEDYRSRLLAAFEAGLAPMEGAVETLAALRVPFCVATSSSPPRLAASLRLVGLDGVFAGRAFTASQVARGKPAPDLFLHAAARMGADPAACVVVEDSAAGVVAGLAAGMEVWHFVGGGHFAVMDMPLPAGVTPHRRFARFADIRAARPELFNVPAGTADPT